MPRTEAGKRLLALVNASPPIGELLPEAVDAIEAEAVAAERARIRAAVEGLPGQIVSDYLTDDEWINRAAVLAIINPEADDA